MQAEAATRPGASDIQLLRPHLRAQGAAFFWRGIGTTLLRSVPQTGATIVGFSAASRWVARLREQREGT